MTLQPTGIYLVVGRHALHFVPHSGEGSQTTSEKTTNESKAVPLDNQWRDAWGICLRTTQSR